MPGCFDLRLEQVGEGAGDCVAAEGGEQERPGVCGFGFGFGVWGLRFEVWGLGFEVGGWGFGVWSLEFGVRV